ncbi:unnamed protein product [Hyaloperonospora brassicae]|uniref:RxLR effector candidate protein n=1 Tax=Hyaloperonospora brassicae TaxID=162125 RepID=A0AAV0UPT2_HYABA|nr:unnamed protein product [Hyaloperonospora brassicae]
MLIANRPGVHRHYQYTQIPPIRVPVVPLKRGGGERRSSCAQTTFGESWPGPLDRGSAKQPVCLDFQDLAQQPPPAPVLPSSRAGYSWQRLQETIRRESQVHGITKDEDEAALEDKSNGKAGDRERQTNDVPETGSRFYWTRSRGSIV